MVVESKAKFIGLREFQNKEKTNTYRILVVAEINPSTGHGSVSEFWVDSFPSDCSSLKFGDDVIVYLSYESLGGKPKFTDLKKAV